jgi:hypothetical protein
VVWEYMDNAAGDINTAKEEAPKEMPVRRGQVCFLSFLFVPLIFILVVSCGIY